MLRPRLVISLLLLAVLHSAAQTPQPTVTLSGTVVDPQEAVFASANVLLVYLAGLTVSRTTADAQGRFVFNGLAPGEYQLIASVAKANTCFLAALKTVNLKDRGTKPVTLKLRWNPKCRTIS